MLYSSTKIIHVWYDHHEAREFNLIRRSAKNVYQVLILRFTTFKFCLQSFSSTACYGKKAWLLYWNWGEFPVKYFAFIIHRYTLNTPTFISHRYTLNTPPFIIHFLPFTPSGKISIGDYHVPRPPPLPTPKGISGELTCMPPPPSGREIKYHYIWHELIFSML